MLRTIVLWVMFACSSVVLARAEAAPVPALPADSALVPADSVRAESRASTLVTLTPEIEWACSRLSTRDLLRIHGPFGQFVGYASNISSRGFEQLRVVPSMSTAPSMTAVGWDKIESVDVQRGSALRGAFRGAVLTTVLAAVGTGIFVVLDQGKGADVSLTFLNSLVLGGSAVVVGTVVGAGIGAAVPRWERVYRGP